MAIVIHDFEVIAEPPAPAQRDAAASDEGTQPLTAEDLVKLVRESQQRVERLRAH
jgi:hypothetical protein